MSSSHVLALLAIEYRRVERRRRTVIIAHQARRFILYLLSLTVTVYEISVHTFVTIVCVLQSLVFMLCVNVKLLLG